MPSDYEKIRADNIRAYGEDDWYGEMLADMYSDRTHFVLELLQNAQDARAKRILFQVFPDRLEVRHDGRLFNEADVRGVCGLRKGTKADDPEAIGRFGIGFKSVYAYTTRPSIHCGEEHFAIERYVRPGACDALAPEKHWTTLFILPFDRPDVPSTCAVREIGARLGRLSPRTLRRPTESGHEFERLRTVARRNADSDSRERGQLRRPVVIVSAIVGAVSTIVVGVSAIIRNLTPTVSETS